MLKATATLGNSDQPYAKIPVRILFERPGIPEGYFICEALEPLPNWGLGGSSKQQLTIHRSQLTNITNQPES